MSRILIVNHAAEIGGAEEGLLDVAQHYGATGCHVVLFADGPLRGRLERAGIGVTVLHAGAGMMRVRRESGPLDVVRAIAPLVSLGRQLARMARRYDVIYANSQKAAVVALLIGKLVRRPVVWHLHDILSADHFVRLQRVFVVRMANFAARRVIAISDVSRQSFIDCGGDPRLVISVPNGVDVSGYLGVTDDQALAIRETLDLRGARLIGLFGRITPWKGQHVLIEALTHLPGTHAVIVGSPLFGQEAYEARMRLLADSLGVADRVHWLGYRHDVPVLMRMVDVVVHTSVSPEPFGRVIVQGLLARRPVLASQHGASAELLGRRSPWLVSPNDPLALAKAVQDVFDTDAATLLAQVETHRERVTRLFSLPQMMSGIERAVGVPA